MIVNFGQVYHIESIIFVNDKGGSISPSGSDQFPPLMSCDRWVILVLEKQWAQNMKLNKSIQSHCDTSA